MFLKKTISVASFEEKDDPIINYTGYQVLRTIPQNQEQVEMLLRMEFEDKYLFWSEIGLGYDVDIMASAGQVGKLKSDLALKNIQQRIMIADVGEQMRIERTPAGNPNHRPSITTHKMTWTAYHSLDDMYTFLDFLETTYDFVTTETIGQSFEGRDMRVAKVCQGCCGNKPAVWIDGGIHAREWISPATVTWMLKELVENNAAHPDLTQNMDW